MVLGRFTPVTVPSQLIGSFESRAPPICVTVNFTSFPSKTVAGIVTVPDMPFTL